MRTPVFVFVTALLAAIPNSVMAWDHDDHEKKHWKHRDFDDDSDRDHHRRYGDACFREEHLRVIRDYYGPRNLPPGLQKKFHRTGQLPPGWQKKVQPFPLEIERRLPPICGGCARGYVDGYAVVYRPRSGVILDFHAVLVP
jgi:hypothetical protein